MSEAPVIVKFTVHSVGWTPVKMLRVFAHFRGLDVGDDEEGGWIESECLRQRDPGIGDIMHYLMNAYDQRLWHEILFGPEEREDGSTV